MNLFVVRHGHAAPVGGDILRDGDRPLTERGEEEAAMVAGALARLDEQIAVVLVSPLLRAQQTARILVERLAGPPDLRVTGNLAPGFRPSAFITDVVSSGHNGGIVAVGHQPDLGFLISYLVAGASQTSIAIPAGAVAKIELRSATGAREGTLQWLLTPETLRRLLPA